MYILESQYSTSSKSNLASQKILGGGYYISFKKELKHKNSNLRILQLH